MTSRTERKASEHESVAPLLPWLINGTLEPDEARRVSEHVAACELCRAERRALEPLLERDETPFAGQGTDEALAAVMGRIEREDPRTGTGGHSPAAPVADVSGGGVPPAAANDAAAEEPSARAPRPNDEAPALRAVPSSGTSRPADRRPSGRPAGARSVSRFALGLSAAAAAVFALAAVLVLGDGAPDEAPFSVLSGGESPEPPPALEVGLVDALGADRVREIVAAALPQGAEGVRVVPVSGSAYRIEFDAALPPESVLELMGTLEAEGAVASVEVAR